MDQLAEMEQRISDLETALDDMVARHSALEWIVEHHLAHYLVVDHPARAAGFLDDLSHDGRSAWMATPEGQAPVRPDREADLLAHVRHILGKVRGHIRSNG